jgi:uncharacterized protein (TIGR00369 family)
MSDKPAFIIEPVDDYPGWLSWELSDSSRFNGQAMGRLIVRDDGDGKARLRMFPERRHSNLMDKVHGGAILTLIDIAIFAGSHMLGQLEVGAAVTLDMSVQFMGAGRIGLPLDAEVEQLRETRRLLFLRGLVVQEGDLVASFAATIRKPTSK